MQRRWVYTLALLILCNCLCHAQRTTPSARPASIRGQVRLQGNQPAPAGVMVSLEMVGGGPPSQTQTSDQGKFEFTQVYPAQYEIRIYAAGYEADPQMADVIGVPSAYLTFVLKPKPSSKDPAIPPGGPGASISAVDVNAPDEARKDLESGRKLLSEGKKLDQSIEFFKKAIALYPQYSEAHFLIGVAYSSQKKWDDAEKSLQKAVDLNKGNGTAYVALGSVENEKRNYSEAAKYLTRAVEVVPQLADAHFELGRSEWGLGHWDVAEQHVARANQLRPASASQHILMGNILLRERNAEGALSEFNEALRLEPKGPMADATRQLVARIETALKEAKAGAK
jgi:tetratricopeptide (TPR) repeat protein